MRNLKDIEAETAKVKSKIAATTKIAQLMSGANSAEYLKLIEDVCESAVLAMASLDPHLPQLAIEYAGHKRVYDTMKTLVGALSSHAEALAKQKTRLLELNGELHEARLERKKREEARI